MGRSAAAAASTAAIVLITALAASPSHAEEGPEITKVVVNSGKNIVVGATMATTFTAKVTASHPDGIVTAHVNLWHGTSYDDANRYITYDYPACTTSGTTTTCTMNFDVLADPRDMSNALSNDLAGTWHILATAYAKERSWTSIDSYATTKVQRASKLNVNASPEPVANGKTITVTGKLTRANWDTGTWAGYSGRTVKLQYRPKNSTTYTTIKTLTTSSTGQLSTTVKATTDGYYRYAFAGTSTTPAATATGDYVNVT